MDTNGLTGGIIAASLVVLVPLLAPSTLPAQVMADHGAAEARAAVIDLTAVTTEVAFVGLRRISSESLRNKINLTLPGIGVPLRAYYALNVLRLNRPVWMPNVSAFRVQNRFAAFGWGLGSLF